MRRNTVKWLGLIVAIMFVMPVFGQYDWKSNRHEIKLGIGIVPMTSVENFKAEDHDPPPGNYVDFYLGDKTYWPAVNLTYSYQLKKWLSLGVTLTYAGVFQNRYDLLTDNLRGKFREHYIGLTPTLRFDWLNRKFVRLYSSIGLGVGVDMEYSSLVENNYSMTDNNIIPTIDAVCLGAMVGRKIYIFSELGLGFNGFLKVGIGYRFN